MAANKKISIGIIGGSGLYHMEELKKVKEIKVKTPFGEPSDAIITGEIEGISVAFLPRHSRGHRFLPSEIPQRANIYALKSLGVETVISVSAVGSLQQKYAPEHFVFPDQMVDATKHRVSTFFGEGIVAHAGFAHPFCNTLSALLYSTAKKLGITAHKGGTLLCMEGPQFSTKAESEFHRKMGYSIIGMTTAPEAKLSREAQFCYAPVSLVTDYDVWKEGEEVTIEKVVQTLNNNIAAAKKLIKAAVPLIAAKHQHCACRSAMKGAIQTDPKIIPAKTAKKLKLIIDGI